MSISSLSICSLHYCKQTRLLVWKYFYKGTLYRYFAKNKIARLWLHNHFYSLLDFIWSNGYPIKLQNLLP
jgi:hypothetical protein